MRRLYVRQDGNDTTGDGTVLRPYLTIYKATSVWQTNDLIDVGEGEFIETQSIVYVERGLIIGQGFGLTTVKIEVPASGWIALETDDLAALLVVANLTIDQSANGTSIIEASNVITGFQIVMSHILFKLQGGYVVSCNTDGLQVDILNSILTSRQTDRAGLAFWTTSPTVLVRNSIFTRLELVTDDQNDGQPIDSDFNLFYDNDREFRIGSYGQNDIRDLDPKMSSVFVPANDSPLRNAGTTLLDGYGSDSRTPPIEILQDFGFDGSAPEIGLIETLEPSGAIGATATNVRTLLDTFGLEIDAVRALIRQSRFNRDVLKASPAELQRRFAQFLGVERITSQDVDEYRAFIAEMLELSRSSAPSRRAIERVVEEIWGTSTAILQHDRSGRFRLGTDLKLSAVHIVPGDDTLTVRLTAGEIQVNDVWYRVDETDIILDINETVAVIAGPVIDILPDGTVGVGTADPIAQSGYVQLTTAGLVVWRNGSNVVTGIATTFETDIAEHDIVSIEGSLRRYVVDEVVDDVTIRLRTAVLDDDQQGNVAIHSAVAVLGLVTTDQFTITSIQSPGRLGQTAFADSHLGRAHAYDVLIDDPDGDINIDDDPKFNTTAELIRAFSSVHKLVALSFVNTYPAGKFVSSVRHPSRLAIDYLEDVGDATWPTS